MPKKHLTTYIVNFQQTYRTAPSAHYPEGHVKTVHRRKEVLAANPNSARHKAIKAVGKPGHFHSFEIKPAPRSGHSIPYAESTPSSFRSQPIWHL
jgi:hypothetical protein